MDRPIATAACGKYNDLLVRSTASTAFVVNRYALKYAGYNPAGFRVRLDKPLAVQLAVELASAVAHTMTDPQILIVDAAHIDPARAQFPGLLVLANKAEGDDFTDLDLAKMAGRDVILWCHYAALLSEAIAPKAARLRIINGDKTPMSFASRPREAAMYARANLQAYTPAAELPISHPMALPSAAPVAVPAKPSASVTPITEARVKQQAKAQDEPIEYAEFAEDALANGFSERHPELRYVSRWSKWLEWTDLGWVEDTTLHIYDLTRLHCRACAAGNPNAALSSIRKVKSAATRASVENLARSDRRHAATAEQWDADPMILLNTPGGLVDLRTGAIRPVRLDDYCLRLTSATPIDKPIPRWLSFLEQTTGGDANMIAYLRRLGGYAMTGDVREEQKFLGFIYGPGGNGKSVPSWIPYSMSWAPTRSRLPAWIRWYRVQDARWRRTF